MNDTYALRSSYVNVLWNGCGLTASFLETLRGKKQKNRNFHQLKSEAKHQFRRVMPACIQFSSFTSAIQTRMLNSTTPPVLYECICEPVHRTAQSFSPYATEQRSEY